MYVFYIEQCFFSSSLLSFSYELSVFLKCYPTRESFLTALLDWVSIRRGRSITQVCFIRIFLFEDAGELVSLFFLFYFFYEISSIFFDILLNNKLI